MSLTSADLDQIRTIVKEAFEQLGRPIVREEVRSYFNADGRQLIRDEIEALENDIKEIYKMLSQLQHPVFTDKQFAKLDLEQKLKALHAETLAAAKQAGIKLPGHSS